MSEFHTAIKYRIYPTDEQMVFFQKTFGCCRFVYNIMLTIQKELYDRNSLHLNKFDSFSFMTSEIKSRFPFLQEADSHALMNSCFDLDTAYKNFFNKTANFPKFKSKKNSRLSYTTDNQKGTVAISDKYIKLPKAGMVRANVHKIVKDAIIKQATISKEDDKFYCSVVFKQDIQVSDKTVMSINDAIGLDFNENTLYVDDNGNIPLNPNVSYSCRSLKHQQRKLSRMMESHITGYRTVGNKRFPIYDKPLAECKNIQKQKKLISKKHGKIVNQKTDFQHKVSNQITNDYALICIEDLSIKSMMLTKRKEHSVVKRHNLNRNALSGGWYGFTNKLIYKAERKGCHVIKVPRTFPSSQLCSCCGHTNPKVKDLKIRDWICPNCNKHHDRDINAAINIRNKGYEIYCMK